MSEKVSAFPHLNPNYDGNWDKEPQRDGMDLRDWFAGMALAGMFSNISLTASADGGEDMADAAYAAANAMMAEREKAK